jgi:hypothetical protein
MIPGHRSSFPLWCVPTLSSPLLSFFISSSCRWPSYSNEHLTFRLSFLHRFPALHTFGSSFW